jgi:hypothetical protein
MPPDQPSLGPGASPRQSSLDEAWVEAWLAAAWRRWRALHGMRCVVIGLGIGSIAHAVAAVSPSSAVGFAAGVGLLSTLLALAASPGLRDIGPVVARAEADNADLRNALFAWHEGRAAMPAAIAQRLAAHARRTLAVAPPSRPVTRTAWVVAIAMLTIGVAAGFIWPPSASVPLAVTTDAARAEPAPTGHTLSWRAVVTPPAYARRPPQAADRPTKLDVLAGSRVDLTFAGWPGDAVASVGGVPLAVNADETGLRTARITASMSDVVLVQNGAGGVLAAITLVVVPDAAPAVRITAPAADVRRAAATGTIVVQIAARDDLGLRDLRLRYTRVSGSGESFTFEEGEWPVAVTRTSGIEWTGTYTVDLAAAGLAPGDSIAYHAVAHDARVGADGASESERFLIEITRPGALTAGDFSLPEPEEKFALSQRMVIQLTERLLERRPRITADEFRQQAQMLAIAQRRVRAEFVFMLGGEVEDEFEEAAHSHEIESGRQDNRGQGDLTEAVRQMSQAETRLTAAEVREALPYEYKALAALQAAFGKARYFMRTLPAPVQIDVSRRLQGDRTRAASSRWIATPLPDASRAAALDLLRDLDAPGASVASLLPRLVALDRGNGGWVAEIQHAVSNGGAVDVTRALRARLLPASPTWMPMPLPRSSREAAIAAGGGSSTP